MRLLCFSDVHGNVGAVKTMLDDVHRRGAAYDALIFAGDLTNLSGLRRTEEERRKLDAMLRAGVSKNSKKYREYVARRNERFFEESKRTALKILSMLAGERVPLYYIFGNRDRLGKYDLRDVKGLFESPLAICLDHAPAAHMGEGIRVTADKGRAYGRTTILVRHAPGGWREKYLVYAKALLNVTGHTHQAIVYKNFLNTGFLYRDETRGARPMLGGYFDVFIDRGRIVGVSYNDLGGLVENTFMPDGIPGKVYSVHRRYYPFELEFV